MIAYKNNQSKLCESKTASIDFTGDNDSLVFNCNKCSNNKDLSFVSNGIKLRNLNGDYYSINISITSENVDGNVNVTVKGQNPDGLIERENSTITSVLSNQTNYVIVNFNTNNVNYLHVYIDPKNQIAEAEESNNYQLRPFIKKPIKAYLEVNTSFPKADQAIEEYLSAFIDRQATSSSSNLNIIIGRNSATFKNTLNAHTRKTPNNYYYDSSSIIYNNVKIGTIPYTGVVGSFFIPSTSKTYLIAYGKDVEGDIAAVKKLVSNNNFLTDNTLPDRSIILDRYDSIGLSVMDLFHNQDNQPYYQYKYKQNTNFKNVVDKILNDNAYEIAIKTVQTTSGTSYGQNTTLRLKSLNSDHSLNFKDAVLNNTKPVVMSGGIFSDLFTFEDGLGGDLVKEGYDVWTIEMTGGPQIECSTCPDYTYQDLVDYYWPALIAGVQKYSGQSKIDYIGHSNGCRVALDSLKNWSAGKNNAGYYFDTSTGTYVITDLANNPVDTFVGLGCPNSFNGTSRYTIRAKLKGNEVINNLKEDNTLHVSARNYFKSLDPIIGYPLYFFLPNEKVSLNLLDYYNKLANESLDNNIGQGLTIKNLYLITGDYELPLIFRFIDSGEDNDFVVPVRDSIEINISVSSTNNGILITEFRHDQMPDGG